MNHDPSDGGPRPRGRWLPKATHAAALLLGVMVWYALPDERMADGTQSAETDRRVRRRPDSADQASAWIEARLRRRREAETANEQKNVEPATMAEFLEENRKGQEKWLQIRNEELDEIVAKASKLRGISDPAAAIRDALRDNHSYTDELVLFQHWLETDPDSALDELARNWRLLGGEYIPALLERKFGTDWMIGKIADEGLSYRLRTDLAHELGRQSAQGQGLAGLRDFYNSISDPRLKIRMAWHFSFEWPLDEPQTVGRFLAGDVPRELRDVLLFEWAKPVYGSSHLNQWLRELCEELGPDHVKKYFDPLVDRSHPMGNFGPSLERMEARESMTLAEVVQDCRSVGSTPENSLGEAIRTKMHHALDGGSDVFELFGEGQITRAELLEELHRRVPGFDSYPEELEREVWSKMARVADPQEIVQWAAELFEPGEIDERMKQEFSSGSIYGDPRIPLRLARYRTVTKGMQEDRPRSRILDHAAWEWTRWQAVSPAAAEAWRDELPAQEPLLAAIRQEEEMERRRRKNP